jgi:hypothetical protein
VTGKWLIWHFLVGIVDAEGSGVVNLSQYPDIIFVRISNKYFGIETIYRYIDTSYNFVFSIRFGLQVPHLSLSECELAWLQKSARRNEHSNANVIPADPARVKVDYIVVSKNRDESYLSR